MNPVLLSLLSISLFLLPNLTTAQTSPDEPEPSQTERRAGEPQTERRAEEPDGQEDGEGILREEQRPSRFQTWSVTDRSSRAGEPLPGTDPDRTDDSGAQPSSAPPTGPSFGASFGHAWLGFLIGGVTGVLIGLGLTLGIDGTGFWPLGLTPSIAAPLGAGLGTWLFGELRGGTGNAFAATLGSVLGAGVGGGLTGIFIATLGDTPAAPVAGLGIVVGVFLSTLGAAIGYHVSSTDRPADSDEQAGAPSFVPIVGPTPRGDGVVVGGMGHL